MGSGDGKPHDAHELAKIGEEIRERLAVVDLGGAGLRLVRDDDVNAESIRHATASHMASHLPLPGETSPHPAARDEGEPAIPPEFAELLQHVRVKRVNLDFTAEDIMDGKLRRPWSRRVARCVAVVEDWFDNLLDRLLDRRR